MIKIFSKLNKKIFFYIGKQRCGTKSFGDFFRKNNYKIFSWPEIRDSGINDLYWSGRWIDILKSDIIKNYDVFEDGPFQHPLFAKFLYANLNSSHFVFLERSPSDWFDSMIKHSDGYTLGNIDKHCFLYSRLSELNDVYIENPNCKKLPIIHMREKYESIYLEHKFQVLDLFKNAEPGRFFAGDLYDDSVYKKISDFFNLNLKNTETQHSHKSNKDLKSILNKFNI